MHGCLSGQVSASSPLNRQRQIRSSSGATFAPGFLGMGERTGAADAVGGDSSLQRPMPLPDVDVGPDSEAAGGQAARLPTPGSGKVSVSSPWSFACQDSLLSSD